MKTFQVSKVSSGFLLAPFRNLTPVDSIEITEATVTTPTRSASPPNFNLLEFAEDYGPLLHEGYNRSPIHLTDADFSLDVQAEANVNNQFQPTPESFAPSVPEESQPDTGAHDQTSLMRLQNPSCVGFENPNKDAEYQCGVISNYDFNDSFSIPSVCPDTCAVSFQVTQLLEVAKHKEHAAQLLQEAAKCREYTVRSLLATQGVWGVPDSNYSFDTLSTASTYAYSMNQDPWGLQDTTVQNSTPSIPTPLPVI
jgi:hypothetical protein